MGCGSKLVAPKLQEGQELNGVLLHKVFKTKALYVRPSKTLLVRWFIFFIERYIQVRAEIMKRFILLFFL